MERQLVEAVTPGRHGVQPGGATGEPTAFRTGIVGAAGMVTLDRARARNAISNGMRAALAPVLWRWARDPQVYAVVVQSVAPGLFSAGGDVIELDRLAREDMAAARAGLAAEYALYWHLECFSKPTVSLIDGPVMGSGVGLSLYGTHRVAGAGYAFAMPEVAIGFFPDCGVMHALSRLPGHIGTYLALTGQAIGGADAQRLGLATHCIDASEFAGIIAELQDADPIDPVLDRRHVAPAQTPLGAVEPLIARCFAADTVAEILASLAADKGPHEGFAVAAHAAMARASPIALAVTLRFLQLARSLDLRQTLTLDYRLACRFIAEPDFREGVRAQLIDKDRKPRWRPATIADVSEAMVDDYFKPLGAGELELPTRSEMQASRA